MMGTGVGSDESPEMVAHTSLPIEDEITPIILPIAADGYGAMDGVGEEGDGLKTEDGVKKDKKKKKEKSPTKAVSDLLKTDMAAERTFFKWLWTGLHTGAIGSFIFVTFDSDKHDPKRMIVVAFSWIVAFMLVLYGAFAYYRRRDALRTGDISRVPQFTREHSPAVVVVALALVVGVGFMYAIWGDHVDELKGKVPNMLRR